jgi:hypothetical protein
VEVNVTGGEDDVPYSSSIEPSGCVMGGRILLSGGGELLGGVGGALCF